MSLSASSIATINKAIVYLQTGYEKPIDQNAADILKPLAVEVFGKRGQIDFVEGLRDAPFSTLLRAFSTAFSGNTLANVVEYYVKAGIERPSLDQFASDEIVRQTNVLTAFRSGSDARDALRDAPHSAILRLLVAFT